MALAVGRETLHEPATAVVVLVKAEQECTVQGATVVARRLWAIVATAMGLERWLAIPAVSSQHKASQDPIVKLVQRCRHKLLRELLSSEALVVVVVDSPVTLDHLRRECPLTGAIEPS